SAEMLTQANVVETEKGTSFLDNLIQESRKAQNRGMRSRSKGGVMMAGVATRGAFEIVERGVYSIILASAPGVVPKALEQISEDRRPKISASLLRFYHQTYPGWPLALCCFNNAHAEVAK